MSKSETGVGVVEYARFLASIDMPKLRLFARKTDPKGRFHPETGEPLVEFAEDVPKDLITKEVLEEDDGEDI